jgi:polyhydroxybutyrate depolymerase
MCRFIFILACPLLWPLVLPPVMFARMDEMTPTVTDLHQLLEPGTHRVSIRVDDRDRKLIFVTPKGFKPDEPIPIVFFFHGAGGTAQQASRTYGWAEKANAENFFAVFPEGLPVRPESDGNFFLNPHIWRDERAGLPVRGVNDVHFFEELLDWLQAALPIDRQRIYVTGFSNGAGMTFTLGARFADRIAAIAPVSSQSFARIDALARPLPVYYLTGTADPLIPYHGGTATLPWGTSRTLPPVRESAETWARLDGCPPGPQVVSDSNGVRVVRYGPGRDQAEVFFTSVEGNGHHWPGTVEPLPHFICGPTLDPFNATDRIWNFFVQHPLR